MDEAPRKRHRKQEDEKLKITTIIEAKSDQHNNILPSSNIVPDILYDILLRLPVKTLQRFKCVSKSWHALITDPIFVKSHLDRSTFNSANYCHVLSTNNLRQSETVCLTFLDRQTSDVNFLYTNPVPSHTRHGNSPLCWPYQFWILGSCNGLILIRTISSITQLWNPTTGESKTLARIVLSHRSMELRYFISGLGYDSRVNKYKAVVFASPEYHIDGSTSSMHLCTSSKTRGNWKSVDVGVNDFPYGIETTPSRVGITVNGSPHWVVCMSKQEYYSPATIIYFDMAEERFKMLPTLSPPVSVSPLSTLDTNIALLGGCLCAIYKDRAAKSFDIWAMKEYGAKESWTKLFVFRHSADIVMPLGFINNGLEVVMEINKRYILSHYLSTDVNTYIDSSDFKSGDYVAYSEHLLIPGSPFLETAKDEEEI